MKKLIGLNSHPVYFKIQLYVLALLFFPNFHPTLLLPARLRLCVRPPWLLLLARRRRRFGPLSGRALLERFPAPGSEHWLRAGNLLIPGNPFQRSYVPDCAAPGLRPGPQLHTSHGSRLFRNNCSMADDKGQQQRRRRGRQRSSSSSPKRGRRRK